MTSLPGEQARHCRMWNWVGVVVNIEVDTVVNIGGGGACKTRCVQVIVFFCWDFQQRWDEVRKVDLHSSCIFREARTLSLTLKMRFPSWKLESITRSGSSPLAARSAVHHREQPGEEEEGRGQGCQGWEAPWRQPIQPTPSRSGSRRTPPGVGGGRWPARGEEKEKLPRLEWQPGCRALQGDEKSLKYQKFQLEMKSDYLMFPPESKASECPTAFEVHLSFPGSFFQSHWFCSLWQLHLPGKPGNEYFLKIRIWNCTPWSIVR